jgi:uncharacterized membrane protein
MDMSMSYEYTRIKEEDRRRSAAWMGFFWLIATVIFGSWGGYIMYQSMAIVPILMGMLLLVLAVITAFLMICSTLDLMED